METSKSTPGPWKQDGRLIVDTSGDAVAMVNIARPVLTAHSDARMIAAAPRMYQTLLNVSAHFDRVGNQTEIAQQVEDALRAAEGK